MNFKLFFIILLTVGIVPAFAQEQVNPTLSMVNFDIDYSEFKENF